MFTSECMHACAMPTENVFLRKGNREKLRKAEERTDLSLARLINFLVEEGHLEELLTKYGKGNLDMRTG